MKQSVAMMVLLVITVLGLGKVALPFLVSPEKEALVAAMGEDKLLVALDIQSAKSEEILMKVEIDKPVAEKKTISLYESWSGEWLVHELIPSVEAAESMPLAEERRSNDQGAVKVAKLREMKRKLDSREKALDEREMEAKKAETRAKDKIFDLEQLETRIKDLLAQEKSIKDKKIKRLTAVYEGMKAEKAAPVIGQMKLSIVVKIFSRMSEKQVGKILSFLPPKKAVV
ncbi:MAG: hypothetical protein R8M45_07415, partial [Ghiorsea sp.]